MPLQEHPVLGQVVLGFTPVIDRQRAVVATRLSVFPERADLLPDAAALMAALDVVWPAPAEAPLQLSFKTVGEKPVHAALPPLWLNLASEGLLQAALLQAPAPHRMLEVPAFLAADPARTAALQALHAAGVPLALSGRLLSPLSPALLACFSHALAAADTPWPAGPAPVRAGVHRAADLQAAFEQGAVAAVGAPTEDSPAVGSSRRSTPPDVQAVMALIDGVNREAPVNQLEPLLKRDPTLAFRLMRYLNSPAFGLSVEVNSLGHALMLLGYQRLKRWLAVLLASSSKDPNARPLMYAAVRRGLLMEELVRPQRDSELGGEMFLCGVFSLLDRLLGQPLPDLLQTVPVPDRVQQALTGGGGPYQPYLALVQAIESDAVFDIRERSEQLMLSAAEVNRALLAALTAARQLD
jgi:EAL and modified HD-GYP domain-containing signal transduction protein